MGSSSLKAEVNALARLQIVHGWNSSYFASSTYHARCGQGVWGFELALDKRFVDDHLGGYVRQFASLPGLHLLSHRLKVSLHSINTNRCAVDDRERLQVLREHGGEDTLTNVSEFWTP